MFLMEGGLRYLLKCVVRAVHIHMFAYVFFSSIELSSQALSAEVNDVLF